MRIIAALTVLLIVAANISSQTADDPDDMKKCIEEIRAWGMSEQARLSLATVAGMRIWGSSWEFKKDESSGMYWTGFTSNRCSLPGQDPVQAERERMEYKYRLDSEVLRLKALADSNGSGFISTDEGREFRKLLEFGYKAAYIARQEKGDRSKICQGLRAELGSDDLEALDKWMADYEKLRGKAEKNGLKDLPEIVVKL